MEDFFSGHRPVFHEIDGRSRPSVGLGCVTGASLGQGCPVSVALVLVALRGKLWETLGFGRYLFLGTC